MFIVSITIAPLQMVRVPGKFVAVISSGSFLLKFLSFVLTHIRSLQSGQGFLGGHFHEHELVMIS